MFPRLNLFKETFNNDFFIFGASTFIVALLRPQNLLIFIGAILVAFVLGKFMSRNDE